MQRYKYVAVGADGAKQAGVISAPTAVSARYELMARELKVRSLRERKKFNQIEITKKKVKALDIANLSRQLSAFLRAGIPILDALEAISSEVESPVLRQMLTELADQLRGGDSFSDAIATHAEHFPSYYPRIVRSAELSGQLDSVLDQLASYIDRDLATRQRVKSALTYPIILGFMSVGTVAIMVVFVLPKFAEFFKGFDAELPLTTRIILGLGDVVGKWGWAIGLGFAVFTTLLVLYGRTNAGRYRRSRIALRLPVVRDVVQAAVVERFCRILSAMMSAGIPIADSMTAAIDSTDNQVFTRALVPASERMLQGEGLATPLNQTGLFPGMVTQMMRVGEETGTLDNQLEIAADFYEKELSFRLDKMTALFEPAMIVAMGLVIGFVAVALVQAMYGIYNSSNLG